MTHVWDHWQRKYHAPSDSDALLFYVAYGDIADKALNRWRYRCDGIPAFT